jgi:predicted secreted protein
MSNPTTPFSWQMPTATDLVTDLPADFAVFGQAVATSMADLLGGTTGQVLSKTTNADMDFTWVTTDDTNAIQNAIVDAKGDLIGATAADTPARLAVGTNGQILTADSTAATGLKWVTAAGSGLTLINRTTFTNQASVTIDSLFSATYKTYLIVIENILAATGADDLHFQLRYGSTTQNNYYYGASVYGVYNSNTINNIQNGAPAAQFTILQNCNGNASMWINNVGSSSQAGMFHGTAFDNEALRSHQFAGTAANNQTYTGIVLKSSSTNITGAVAIYGLGI